MSSHELAAADPPATPPPGGQHSAASRRGFVLAGIVAVGATAAGLKYGTTPKQTVTAPAESVTPTVAPVPSLPPLADPTPFLTIPALSDVGVMQDFSYLPDTRTVFVTQKTNGANGSSLPYETLIVNRVDASGRTQDAMTLIDGGHGLGIEAQAQPDGTDIWITWHGKTADSDWRESDFVRLRYTPGVWTRGQANQMLGLVVVAQADGIEAQYRFDWASGWAVERHFDFNGTTETYKRRRITDLLAGTLLPDGELDVLPLPVNPPTTQGFATIDDTLYRWCGAGTSADVMVAGDPIRLQRWDWPNRQLVGDQTFPDLSRGASGWPDGSLEPEGAAVYRAADGSATLLVGDSTGFAPHHVDHVSAFERIAVG